jgi:hypothetical protein
LALEVTLPPLPTAAHDEAELLLPWYTTGQLEGEDRARVERHLANCVTCRRQLRFDQEMIESLQARDPVIDSGWERLRSCVESEDRRPWGAAWRKDLVTLIQRPAVATLIAAQIALFVVGGGVLLSLDRPQFHALGDASAPASANVIIIFRPDASQQDVLQTLRESGASLVGGPTAADAYLVHVEPGRRLAALAQLRANADIRMVQPIDGEAR